MWWAEAASYFELLMQTSISLILILYAIDIRISYEICMRKFCLVDRVRWKRVFEAAELHLRIVQPVCSLRRHLIKHFIFFFSAVCAIA